MGQYGNNPGRVATSWIADSKNKNKTKTNKAKTNKTNKAKAKNNTSFLKILGLQSEYLQDNEEWNLHRSFRKEYRTYLNDKSASKCFHYQNLTTEEVDELVRLYDTKLLKRAEKCQALRKTKEKKRQMRKMISETREEKVTLKRAELVAEIKIEMDRWSVVLGRGDYLFDRDRTWNKMYQRLHSDRKCHLYNIQSDDDWYQFLMKG